MGGGASVPAVTVLEDVGRGVTKMGKTLWNGFGVLADLVQLLIIFFLLP